MSTVGIIGSLPDSLHQALTSAGHTLVEADKPEAPGNGREPSSSGAWGRSPHPEIVLVRVKGDWPAVSKCCFVIALLDSLADAGAAYRSGAHAVAPLDAEVLGTLIERVATERSVRRLADLERQAILSAIKASAGNTARAAAMLDISVRKVQYKLHEYGVPLSRKSPRNGTHL